jgi:hypothetical protein
MCTHDVIIGDYAMENYKCSFSNDDSPVYVQASSELWAADKAAQHRGFSAVSTCKNKKNKFSILLAGRLTGVYITVEQINII